MCRDHHQVVLEYISVIIELSVKIDNFLHLMFINEGNNIHEGYIFYAKG
jgi:hypothetical protein